KAVYKNEQSAKSQVVLAGDRKWERKLPIRAPVLVMWLAGLVAKPAPSGKACAQGGRRLAGGMAARGCALNGEVNCNEIASASSHPTKSITIQFVALQM